MVIVWLKEWCKIQKWLSYLVIIYTLVGGAITILKNMSSSDWEGLSIHIMENKSHVPKHQSLIIHDYLYIVTMIYSDQWWILKHQPERVSKTLYHSRLMIFIDFHQLSHDVSHGFPMVFRQDLRCDRPAPSPASTSAAGAPEDAERSHRGWWSVPIAGSVSKPCTKTNSTPSVHIKI